MNRRLPMPDPNEATKWRQAAETSRQQYPHMPDRAAYYDAMADWHYGVRMTMPAPLRAVVVSS